MKAYRDIVNAVNTARIKDRNEGWGRRQEEEFAKGERKKQIEITRQMISYGIPVNTILKYTGPSEKYINKLQEKDTQQLLIRLY